MKSKIFKYLLCFVCCLIVGAGIVMVVKQIKKPTESEVTSGFVPDGVQNKKRPARVKTKKTPQLVNDSNQTHTNDTVKVDTAKNLLVQAEAAEEQRIIDENKKQEELRRQQIAEEAKKKAESAKMTASEFEQILKSGNTSVLGGKNPKVAKVVRFSFKNIKDDEPNKPDDITAIRQKMSMGIWSNIIVQSVGYDAQYRINSAVITVVY